MDESGKLSIVSTPIGNLWDITLRALDTLKNADIILCEDTRHTAKILRHYVITSKTESFHAHSDEGREEKVICGIKEGKKYALVSDAGTPCISDPGAMLISKIKEDLSHGVDVIPVPGATALITALSASGLPIHEFTFLGFLPHKKGRETLFKEITESKRTIVFYESPHRILKTLEALVKFCPNKKVCIARELTKIYEEFKTGSAEELLIYFEQNPVKQKGEFTVVVA